ncbi:PREDICTED: O-acyltransferase WSD1-like [Erythranthe guttata]|uniref:O-acyltransferase WSD1-like n=1 Tax=Erythranthe guttata TaxID=4155 RepID=UPI00064DDD75|nr:PREDICTED: O-acyltransferase WSD1-like [Erythranthe guttata]|eukprot:XP_012842408.1 PREDICTED: O-acyltransferase WSD1-like [Erythranthe guttata]
MNFLFIFFSCMNLLKIEKDKRLGKYSWKRTKVDIEKHVFAPELDPDMESPDEFVEKFVSALSRQTLDPTKPLWEIHILNVKTSDANSTAVFKIDHSIGDGVSLISLVLACAAMRRSSNNPGVEYLPVMPSKKQKTNIGILVVMKRLFLSFWTGFLIIYYTLIDLIMVLATMLFLKDTKTPIKGERGVENSPKRFVHRIFDLDDVKLVKNAMHVSVNDVLMGVTEAGLSHYLNTRYGISFNLRPSPSVKDLIEVMDEKRELMGMWGNLVGIVLVPLTIALEDEPLAYIRRAKSTMDRKKLSLAPHCIYVLLKLLINFFGTKVFHFFFFLSFLISSSSILIYYDTQAAVLAAKNVSYKTTVGFSNVVGPKEETNLFGHPLSYISPTASGFPLALVINYQSYGNKLVIAVAADEKLIPNPHQICDDLHNSLQVFKEAVIKKGLVQDASYLC